jgi:hypothetical protein
MLGARGVGLAGGAGQGLGQGREGPPPEEAPVPRHVATGPDDLDQGQGQGRVVEGLVRLRGRLDVEGDQVDLGVARRRLDPVEGQDPAGTGERGVIDRGDGGDGKSTSLPPAADAGR